jgi:hypothetical protein
MSWRAASRFLRAPRLRSFAARAFHASRHSCVNVCRARRLLNAAAGPHAAPLHGSGVFARGAARGAAAPVPRAGLSPPSARALASPPRAVPGDDAGAQLDGDGLESLAALKRKVVRRGGGMLMLGEQIQGGQACYTHPSTPVAPAPYTRTPAAHPRPRAAPRNRSRTRPPASPKRAAWPTRPRCARGSPRSSTTRRPAACGTTRRRGAPSWRRLAVCGQSCPSSRRERAAGGRG